MRKAFLASALTLIFTFGTAFAATPPEVLEPYKAYRAALKKDDHDTAKKQALLAWKAAEKTLGDSQITGDLAQNYADIAPSGKEKNPYKNYEARAKAYKRAIELAVYYEEDADIRELERRLLYTELELSVYKHKRMTGNIAAIKETEHAIDKFGLQGSTFDGDVHAIYSRYYQLNNKPDKAIESSKKAIDIYKNRTDGYFSKYEYFIRVFKGDSHYDLSEKQDDLNEKINAALEYQVVMQNLEGTLPSDHSFVKEAFHRWMKTRSEIEEAGDLEKAEAAGLCECWPFEDYKDKVVPLERVPPMMPRRAKRSGHVNVLFDVDDKGSPENIEIVSSSHPVFEEAAVKSIKEWKFSKAEGGSDPKDRLGISNKITFRLTNERGTIIPE